MAKFFRRGISLIKWLPVVAAPASGPTSGEVTAGVDITQFVSDIAGFQLSNAPISVPNLKDIFTPQIQGEDTIADSTLTLNDDNGTALNAIRTAMSKGTAGYLVFYPYGATASKRVEVWPATVTGVNDTWSVGTDPAQVVFGYAITAVPSQTAVAP